MPVKHHKHTHSDYGTAVADGGSQLDVMREGRRPQLLLWELAPSSRSLELRAAATECVTQSEMLTVVTLSSLENCSIRELRW
jgi:hypothetical protein